MNVAKPDVIESLELHADVWDRAEEVQRLLDRHLEDVRNRATLVVDLERFPVVALALADLAADVDVGQELHLDLQDPVALAVLAATALHVEAEPAGTVAAEPGLGDAREQLADRGEEAHVRGRVRAWRPADRALVDLDDLVDVVDAGEAVVGADLLARAVELPCEGPIQHGRH